MRATPEMIEAGATALANEVGGRRGVPRITNVLSAMPKDVADHFREDAKAVIEVALAMIPPGQFTDREGSVWQTVDMGLVSADIVLINRAPASDKP